MAGPDGARKGVVSLSGPHQVQVRSQQGRAEASQDSSVICQDSVRRGVTRSDSPERPHIPPDRAADSREAPRQANAVSEWELSGQTASLQVISVPEWGGGNGSCQKLT